MKVSHFIKLDRASFKKRFFSVKQKNTVNQEESHELPANFKPSILQDDIVEYTTSTVQPKASPSRKSNKSTRYLQQKLTTGSENDSSSMTEIEKSDKEKEAAFSSRRNSKTKIKMLLDQRRQSNNKRKSSPAIHTTNDTTVIPVCYSTPVGTDTTVNQNDGLDTTTEITRKTNTGSNAAFYNKSIVIRI